MVERVVIVLELSRVKEKQHWHQGCTLEELVNIAVAHMLPFVARHLACCDKYYSQINVIALLQVQSNYQQVLSGLDASGVMKKEYSERHTQLLPRV